MKRQRTTPYYIYSTALTLLLALVLAACGHGHQQQLLQLEELERQNRADSLMTNDSLALALTQYFDRHGTPNEQMRAHYMLGRTYYDMREAPMALRSFHNAIGCADTLSPECDLALLCRIYGQTAAIFYQQGLYREQLEYNNLSFRYGLRGGDTLCALRSYAMNGAAYDKLQLKDSAIQVYSDAIRLLRKYNYNKVASGFAGLLAKKLIDKGVLEGVDGLLMDYEQNSGYFDANNNIAAGREVYYYAKGLYYLQKQRLDSAEYYFRKELRTGTDFNNQNCGAYGLAMLFQQTSKYDSVAKYLAYSYAMNDSMYAKQATKEVEQAKAIYDYSRQQELAQVEKSRADRNEKHFWIAGFFLLLTSFLTTVACYSYYRLSKKKKEREAEYQELKSRHQQICEELSNLYRLNQYQPPLPTVEQSQEETSSLRNREKELERMISKKQQEANELQKKLYAYEQEFEARKVKVSNIMNQLKDTPIHKTIQTKANKCELLTEEEWSEFETALEHVDSQFFSLVSAKRNEMSMSEYHVCLLSRIGIKPSLAGNMIGVKPAYVSDMRKHLLKILFGIDGSAKQLDSLMRQVC